MSQSENFQQGHGAEIDLVDLVAVLYRRKTTLLLVLVACIAASVAYWLNLGEKSTITMSFETGRNETKFIIEPEESSTLLLTLYLPRYIDIDIDVDDFGGGAIGFNCKLSDGTILENFQVAAGLAFEDLLKLHNVKFEKYLQGTTSQLSAKIKELEATKLVAVSPGHTAVDLAEQHTIEASIITLQNRINISYPSRISDTITISPIPSRGVLLFAIIGIVVGIFAGCVLVFVLELVSQAKVRLAESA